METSVLDFGREGIVLPHGPLADGDWEGDRLVSRLLEHCRYFDAVANLVDPIVYGKQGNHAGGGRRMSVDEEDGAAIGKPKSKKARKAKVSSSTSEEGKAPEKAQVGRKRPHSEVAPNSGVEGGSGSEGLESAAAAAGGRSSGGSSYAELQERLRAKLEAMKSKRGGSKSKRKKEKGDKGALSLAAAARQRRKSAGGGAAKAGASSSSSSSSTFEAASGADAQALLPSSGDTGQPARKRARQAEGRKAGASSASADVGSLDFGQLTAKRGGARGIDDEMRRRSRQRRKSGDLSTLLERAKANQSKLAELRGTEQGKAMEQEQQWDAAARRAAGEKVKDDPKLLARALKRRERSKAKSAEAWADRKATAEQQTAARQARREANLQRQIDHKKGIKPSKGKGPKGKQPGGRAGPHSGKGQGAPPSASSVIKRPGGAKSSGGGKDGRRAGFEGKRATLNRGGSKGF